MNADGFLDQAGELLVGKPIKWLVSKV